MSVVNIPPASRIDRKYPTDGELIVVWLKSEVWEKYDYYGDPIFVYSYGHKFKTTVTPIRIDPEDVARWCSVTIGLS